MTNRTLLAGDRFNVLNVVQLFPDEPQAFRNLFLFHVLKLNRFHLVILLRVIQFKCFAEELSLDLEETASPRASRVYIQTWIPPSLEKLWRLEMSFTFGHNDGQELEKCKNVRLRD
jgi:hypothetical protein